MNRVITVGHVVWKILKIPWKQGNHKTKNIHVVLRTHNLYMHRVNCKLLLLALCFCPKRLYKSWDNLPKLKKNNGLKHVVESNPRNHFFQEFPCYDVLQETERD